MPSDKATLYIRLVWAAALAAAWWVPMTRCLLKLFNLMFILGVRQWRREGRYFN
jgi:hypothetical protein